MNLPATNRLHQRALECVKNYKRSESDLIQILGEMDETQAYLPLGVSSLFRYCVEILALSESETMRFTQVARKCKEAPALRKAINQGLLTVSKASRIAPVITKSDGALWVQKAISLNHREIEREVAKVNPRTIRRDVIQVRTAERSELRINISKKLESKLERVQEVLGAKGLEDMLERLVDFALKHKDPLSKASQAINRIKSESATWQVNASSASTESLKRPQSRVRVPIARSIKHELYRRSLGGCEFKGCGEKRWLQMHHVLPLAMGGKNDLTNLMLICRNHHSFMHR